MLLTAAELIPLLKAFSVSAAETLPVSSTIPIIVSTPARSFSPRK